MVLHRVGVLSYGYRVDGGAVVAGKERFKHGSAFPARPIPHGLTLRVMALLSDSSVRPARDGLLDAKTFSVFRQEVDDDVSRKLRAKFRAIGSLRHKRQKSAANILIGPRQSRENGFVCNWRAWNKSHG